MTADDLYAHLKESMNFFGLYFHEMHKVVVSINGDFIKFSYADLSIEVLVPNEPMEELLFLAQQEANKAEKSTTNKPE